MKENRVSNEFRQGREATFAALLMELCLCGERIASIMGIRNWYDQVGTVRIFLCILIFCYYYIIKNQEKIREKYGARISAPFSLPKRS